MRHVARESESIHIGRCAPLDDVPPVITGTNLKRSMRSNLFGHYSWKMRFFTLRKNPPQLAYFQDQFSRKVRAELTTQQQRCRCLLVRDRQ